jgi:predicted nucleotidyltransferase component of viral defense system
MISENAIKDRLKNVAREQGTTVTDLLKRLYLERFLTRLAKSTNADKFIFKGGNLLSYFMEIGRESKDLDFLVRKLTAEVAPLKAAFDSIAAVKLDDGFELSLTTIDPLEQNHMNYPGFRASIAIKFAGGSLRDNLQVDLGVGDEVTPERQALEMLSHKDTPFFEENISLLVYPAETIFAEKLETVIAKGGINSRMKDFHDLILMGREKDLLDIEKLKSDIQITFKHRGTDLSLPLQFIDADFGLLDTQWSRHLRGLGPLAERFKMPTNIRDVVLEINNYLRQSNVLT